MRLISRFVQTASLVLALANPFAPATVRAQAAHAEPGQQREHHPEQDQQAHVLQPVP